MNFESYNICAAVIFITFAFGKALTSLERENLHYINFIALHKLVIQLTTTVFDFSRLYLPRHNQYLHLVVVNFGLHLINDLVCWRVSLCQAPLKYVEDKEEAVWPLEIISYHITFQGHGQDMTYSMHALV